MTFPHDIPADRCKSRQKHRRYKASAEKRRSSMCDRGPVGLEWVVGKQYFESQCNGSNPCSKMLEMLLLAVNFSVEVLIQSIKDLMLEGVF